MLHLNCVANGKLLRENIFDDIWIQPAAGDAGGALGAAYIAYHHYKNRPITKSSGHNKMHGSYLGPSYSDEEIEKFLLEHNLPHKKYSEEKLLEIVSDLLMDENVIGWFQGRMEFGPRALGNRSIIGDARSSSNAEENEFKN